MIVNRTIKDVRWVNNIDNIACDVVTNTYPSSTWFARTVPEGEDFIRLSPVTSSNHIDATPWSFIRTSVNNPPWDAIRTAYAQYNHRCKTREFSDRITVDGASWAYISLDMLQRPKYSQKETDFVDSMSMVKAQANLRRAMASLPMLYSERTATVKTIGTYSRAILNNVITLQRKDLKRWIAAVRKHRTRPERLKRIANDISNRHLEFVFGVIPLIDDILGLCEFVGGPQRPSFRTGRGKHTIRTSNTSSEMVPMRVVQRAWKSSTTTTTSYSVRTGLRFDIDSTVLNNASLLGFNPVYSWYDHTPLSFVVGWFSNLNYWLQSLDATPGLTYRTGYSTKRTSIIIDRETFPFRSFPLETFEGSGQCSGESIQQNRVVHSSEPGLQSLHFYDNTSFFAAAASVSLAIQRYVKTAEHEIKSKPFRYRGRKPVFLKPIKYRRVKL